MFPEEEVLVVPTALFEKIGYFQGFCTTPLRYLEELLRPEHVKFMVRGEAETDANFKQLIPYMIFSWTDAQGRICVFRYIRGKGQGESRLHTKLSIGIGGHISSRDLPAAEKVQDLYREGLRRELEEEVVLESEYTETCIGLINDDLTEVGKVHLGIVHRFELKEPKMRSNEPDILESGFLGVDEIMKTPEALESWSRICLEALFPG